MNPFMYIKDILKKSPKIPGYGGEKWAMYSIGCCWWTSFPEDLGVNIAGLPCCPHCCSLLIQAPLKKFIAAAQEKPEHYGKFGIEAFLLAHSQNSKTCHPGWDQYNEDIESVFHQIPPPTFA